MNFVCFPAESPTIVPGSISPIGKIFSNQSHWSMSIEFNKQVNSIDQSKHNVESSARERVIIIMLAYNIIYTCSSLDLLGTHTSGCLVKEEMRWLLSMLEHQQLLLIPVMLWAVH